MKHFRLLGSGFDVEPVVEQLAGHPELWDQYPARTRMDDSPHVETSDIWLRFRDPRELVELKDYGTPHFAVFYPSWYLLPAAHAIVFRLMAEVKAVYLGGILITRIPAGAKVRPHHDRGSWHSEFLNRKVYIVLKANERCTNWCEDEHVIMRPGEAWQFENLRTHGVINDGADERLALICTFRCEP